MIYKVPKSQKESGRIERIRAHVCYILQPYQNGASYDHEISTRTLVFVTKFHAAGLGGSPPRTGAWKEVHP